MTTDEVAERCRKTPETVRYWRMIGYGPVGVKLGRSVVYDEAEVEAWLDKLFQAARGTGESVA